MKALRLIQLRFSSSEALGDELDVIGFVEHRTEIILDCRRCAYNLLLFDTKWATDSIIF